MTCMAMGRHGEVTLPVQVQERYGLGPETLIRLIETRSGILLVPLTDAPITPELARELQQWQALGQETWDSCPYALVNGGDELQCARSGGPPARY